MMRYLSMIIVLFMVSNFELCVAQVKSCEKNKIDFENNLIECLGGENSQWDLSKFKRIDEIPNIDFLDIIKINSPSNMSDGYNHRIYIDHKKLKIYVHRTGGIAGVSEKYGPIKIDITGKLIIDE